MFWLDHRHSAASLTDVQICKAFLLTAHHTVSPYSSSNSNLYLSYISLLFSIGINTIRDLKFSQKALT